MNKPIPWDPENYQIEAVEHLCRVPGAGLFAKPGMRKTSCTLAAFSVLRDQGVVRSMLVVCPLRPAYKVWPSEIEKWADFAGLSYVILHGKDKNANRLKKVDVYIVNYEGLKWLAEAGLPKTIDMLVLDESTKIKHHKAKRSVIATEIARQVKRVVILTGTPRPNTLADLFAQIRALDGGERLGKFITHFHRQYFVEERFPNFSKWTPKTEEDGWGDANEAVQEKIRDICLTLSYEGNLEMPPLFENEIVVELPESARSVYVDLETKFIADIKSGVVTAANAAVAGMKLRQIVGGGVYGDRLQGMSGADDVGHRVQPTIEFETNKLEALRDLIEEQSGEPLLVAVGFLHEVDRIRAYLGDEFGEIPYLGGGVSIKNSNTIIDRWNNGEIPVLLAHPTSVAHGLNLQAGGSSVVWYALTWSSEEFEQFNGRVWRSGQTKPVTIHYIIAEGTIDERVLAVLRGKIEGQNALMEALANKPKDKSRSKENARKTSTNARR